MSSKKKAKKKEVAPHSEAGVIIRSSMGNTEKTNQNFFF